MTTPLPLDVIRATVARTPHAAALVHRETSLTYEQLWSRAVRHAQHLHGAGVRTGDAVALCQQREPDLVAGIIGIMLAGGAYVPLDPRTPPERAAAICETGGVRFALAAPSLRGVFTRCAAIAVVEPPASGGALEHAERAFTAPHPSSLAYVIFTSGSTGRPKGVMIEHGNLAGFLAWTRRAFALDDLRRTAFTTSVAFDVSVFEMFAPLAAGGTILLYENLLALADERPGAGPGFVCGTSSGLRELARYGGLPASVTTVMQAGESLPRDLARSLYAIPSVQRVYNLCGATEDTVYSTIALVDTDGADEPSIGTSFDGRRCYVLDDSLDPVAPGTEGELYYAGSGVARGYAGDPRGTAAAFVPVPFGGHAPGERMYESGDRVRVRPDGSMQFLGRRDNQVKIRGFRVEVEDVESKLHEIPGVSDAAVVAYDAPGGDKELAAFVVCDDVQRVRAALGEKVPSYMIPARCTAMSALPTGTAGKIDRRALGELAARSVEGSGSDAPPGGLEAHVTVLVERALGVTALGRCDDFFQLGGTSLKAMRVLAAVQESFGKRLSLRELYRDPTVRGIVAALAQAAPDAPPTSLGAARGKRFPLSFAQQQVYVLGMLFPDNLAYNANVALHLYGELDVDVLRQTLAALLARHEMFRAALDDAGDEPELVVRDAVPLPFEIVDAPAGADDVTRLVRSLTQTRFDLSAPPLVRWTLIRIASDRHVLVQVEHHFVHDGWSLSLLIGSIWETYCALRDGREAGAPASAFDFGDFVRFQREWFASPEAPAQLAFWREHLAAASPALLDVGRARPARTSLEGDVVRTRLSAALYAAAAAYAGAAGTTVFVVMLAAFARLIARRTGREHFSLGTSFANRRLARSQSVVGMIVNAIALDLRVAPGAPFVDTVRYVRDAVAAAYDAQEYPFDDIVRKLNPKRRGLGNPFFEIAYHFHDSPLPEMRSNALRADVEYLHNGSAKFELNVTNIPRNDGTVETLWEYRPDVFERAEIAELADAFESELARAIAPVYEAVPSIFSSGAS